MTYDLARVSTDRRPTSILELKLSRCGLAWGTPACAASNNGNLISVSRHFEDTSKWTNGNATASIQANGAVFRDYAGYNRDHEFLEGQPVVAGTFAFVNATGGSFGDGVAACRNIGQRIPGTVSGQLTRVRAEVNAVIVGFNAKASIWTDTGTSPGVQIGGDSDSVAMGTVGIKTFSWSSNPPILIGVTAYWIVLKDFTPSGTGNVTMSMSADQGATYGASQQDTITSMTNQFANEFRIEATFNGNSVVSHEMTHAIEPELAASTTYMFAVWLRQLARDWVRLTVEDKAGVVRMAWFNTSTGLFGTVNAGLTGVVENHLNAEGGQWWRVGVSFNSGTGTAQPRVRLGSATGDGNILYDGINVKPFRLTGAQLTESSNLQPYRETYGEAVLPTPGNQKCYETHMTCQDTDHFDSPRSVYYNGNRYTTTPAGAAAAVTFKKFTLVFAVMPGAELTTGIYAAFGRDETGGAKIEIDWSAANQQFSVELRNTANQSVFNTVLGAVGSAPRGVWSVYILTVDTTDTIQIIRLYKGNKLIGSAAISDTHQDTLFAMWGAAALMQPIVGGRGGGEYFAGGMERLALYLNYAPNLTIVAERRRFVDANGYPQNYGPDGSARTGIIPTIFLRHFLLASSEWDTNHGSGPDFESWMAGPSGLAAPLTDLDTAPWTAGTTHTYRFTEPNSDLPLDVAAFPAVQPGSISLSPTILDQARGLGQRASVGATLRDFTYHDRGDVDPYPDDRGFDQEAQGTFLGRLAARNRTSMNNRRVDVLVGFIEGDTFDPNSFQRRQYELEDFSGPDSANRYKVSAKDPLKRTFEKKAQAPYPSTGRLNANLTAVATTCTLLPTGIGEVEYPETGFIRIGEEVMGFTRAVGSDTLTLDRTSVSNFRTVAVAHESGDSVQLCLRYFSESIPTIVYDLLTTYAQVPVEFINKADWDEEAATYLVHQYSALITTPTPVDQLMKELTESAPFYHFYDERTALIVLRAIRTPGPGLRTINDTDHIVAGSLSADEEHALRISRAWMIYGQYNPTKSITDSSNYTNNRLSADLPKESKKQYGTAQIRKVFSRWITSVNGAAADTMNLQMMTRYRASPRAATFTLDAKDADLWTGDIFSLQSRAFQDIYGAPEAVTMQVTEVRDKKNGHQFEYKAIEYAAAEISNERQIIFDVDRIATAGQRTNLRTIHDELFGAPAGPVTLPVYIYSGVVLGSEDASIPALETGEFPIGSVITIQNLGKIQGAGGDGGTGANPGAATDGQIGGDALVATFTVTFTTTGKIYGGGGGGGGGGKQSGGGGGGGGGGAGFQKYTGLGTRQGGDGGPASKRPGSPGSESAGGAGGVHWTTGGNGGGIAAAGAAGQNGGGFGGTPGGSGGAPGKAVVGVAFVTFAPGGDIQGAQV